MIVEKEWALEPLFPEDRAFIDEYRKKNVPFHRENPLHFCATALVVNREFTHVLMIYHKIFDSWSLPGGHADGEEDLLEVGKKEAREETGLDVEPYSPLALAWDVISVSAHEKKGQPIPSHFHLVGTYLYFGDLHGSLVKNEEETLGVKWIPLSHWEEFITEKEMIPYYKKDFARAKVLLDSLE